MPGLGRVTPLTCGFGRAAARAWHADRHGMSATPHTTRVPAGEVELDADVTVPAHSHGVVVFAHGSGSSRFSPRNRYVAESLQGAGLATVLADLLTGDEERLDARTGHIRFDIGLLADRVVALVDWVTGHEPLARLPVGLFGASTGAAAALVAAARRPGPVRAVVSRGGRPDLAGEFLAQVRQPTLLVVGGRDTVVIDLNRRASEALAGEVRVEIVPGATHLFEEPGALEEVARLAGDWFTRHLSRPVRLALLGPPGAGKGTQAAALAQRFGVPAISTGELLRRRASADDVTGRALAGALARGELVADDVVVALVNEALANEALANQALATEALVGDALATGPPPPGYVLDGYPRTLAQATDPRTPPLDAVVHLSLPDDVTRARIARRHEGRSDDADRAAVETRLRVYHDLIAPLCELYGERGLLVVVDATPGVDEVTDAIVRALADRRLVPHAPV